MSGQIELGNIAVDVVHKDIKNVYLSIHRLTGRARISAPRRMSLDTIRGLAISKLGWIKQQQGKWRGQDRKTPRGELDRASYLLWGERYELAVVEGDGGASMELDEGRMRLRVRRGTDRWTRGAIIEGWYRQQLREAVPPLLAKWEPVMGVKVARLFVRRMKSKWGSCRPATRSIRLNTELARRPSECLEYILVHEMAHLLEPTHNARFKAIMDRLIPQWRVRRRQLNQLPVRQEQCGR
jgi:predicted metal-dependent hydrolase